MPLRLCVCVCVCVCLCVCSLADVLDVKTLGCVPAEECEVVTRVEIFPQTTIYTMTRSCCDTDLCNASPSLPLTSRLPLALAALTAMLLAAPSSRDRKSVV